MAQTINLNMLPKGIPNVVNVSQFDVGREIVFKLYDEASVYTIPTGATVVIAGRKADNHVFAYNATISQDRHYVTVVTTQQMTACAGENLCQLRVTKSGIDLATVNFTMMVQERPDASGDISDSDLPVIIALAIEQEQNAEAWATGTKDGTPVGSSAPQYHNNSKYYSEESEAWAVGTKDGTAVSGSAPQYHNNSKYYADEAAEIVNNFEGGAFADATVKNAFSLLNVARIAENSPFVRRRSGGTVSNVALEHVRKIIGATVAWNQMVQNGNFADGTNNWSNNGTITKSVSNGVMSISSNGTGANEYVYQFMDFVSDHKYFIFITAYSNNEPTELSNGGIAVYAGSSTSVKQKFTSTKTSYVLPLASPVSIGTTKVIRLYSNNQNTAHIENIMVVDLTQMFGVTIANYIYTLETTTAGAGIAKLKEWGFFTKEYYAYDTGSLQSVCINSKKNMGFNVWDEVWEMGSINPDTGVTEANAGRIRSKNYVPVLGGVTYYFKCPSTSSCRIAYYNSSKQYISGSWNLAPNSTFTTPSNCAYMKFSPNNDYGTTYKNDICISVSDANFNGQYKPYTAVVNPFDYTKEFRGLFKLDANNNLYADGDDYYPDGSVKRRYGIVDLGTLTYTYSSGTGYMTSTTKLSNSVDKTGQGMPNAIISNGFNLMDRSALSQGTKAYTIYGAKAYFYDVGYTDVDAFKTAMSGVYLVYELATATTETANKYNEYMAVFADGTEEFVDYKVEQETRDVAIPAGRDSEYNTEVLIGDLFGTDESGRKTASRAYTSGEYFYKDGKMYKVTTAIAQNAAFTEGTNCSKTTIFAELTALNA